MVICALMMWALVRLAWPRTLNKVSRSRPKLRRWITNDSSHRIILYLVIVAYVGSLAYAGKREYRDFFLASAHRLVVFFLSLFATNMTAFAILGSSVRPTGKV